MPNIIPIPPVSTVLPRVGWTFGFLAIDFLHHGPEVAITNVNAINHSVFADKFDQPLFQPSPLRHEAVRNLRQLIGQSAVHSTNVRCDEEVVAGLLQQRAHLNMLRWR
jgi:hypothetical protein